MKTAALFGGSFDPVHRGHIDIVEAALCTLDVDKVIVMPAFLNPFKTNVYAPPELRMKWLKEIFADEPKVEVNDFELACKRKVPSLETVKHLKKEYDRLYLIIGADNLTSLHKWYGYDELKTLVTFVVATRENIPVSDEYIVLDVRQNISATELRNKIDKKFLHPKTAAEIEKFYKEING